MSERRIGRSEKVAKKVMPLLAVAGLALTACSNDKATVPSQLTDLRQKAIDLCAGDAKAQVAEQFPVVTLPNKTPTLKQLQEAETAIVAKESQAPAVLKELFDRCYEGQIGSLAASYSEIPPMPTDAPTSTAVVASVTSTTQG